MSHIRARPIRAAPPLPGQAMLGFVEPLRRTGIIKIADLMRRARPLEPMAHLVAPPEPRNPPADMGWLTGFMPSPGWVPTVDLHGFTLAGWEWRICDQPHSARLTCLAARVGWASRWAEVEGQAAAVRWVEALPA